VDFGNTSHGCAGSYFTKRQGAIGSFRDEHSKSGGSVIPNIIPSEQRHTRSLATCPTMIVAICYLTDVICHDGAVVDVVRPSLDGLMVA
jgi:hypothetical protein